MSAFITISAILLLLMAAFGLIFAVGRNYERCLYEQSRQIKQLQRQQFEAGDRIDTLETELNELHGIMGRAFPPVVVVPRKSEDAI